MNTDETGARLTGWTITRYMFRAAKRAADVQ